MLIHISPFADLCRLLIQRLIAMLCHSFYDKDAPIYTMSRFLPPSKVLDKVKIRNAIIGDGSLVKANATISNSIIGLRSLIGEGTVIEDTLMLGSDYYETLDECAYVPGCLPMGVGAGSHIRKVSQQC
jgi:glucose-1-phosphate adenylyltransferase